VKHREGCYCNTIHRNYGKRPFKCSFVGCSFKRYGFETQQLRDSHIKHHDRPWKCTFPNCEFAEGGFLSRKMRDDHFDRFHQDKGPLRFAGLKYTDIDEIQPLIFDLVKLDKVDAVRNFLPQFKKLPDSTQIEMRKAASFSGSSSMLDLIGHDETFELELLKNSVYGRNLDTFRYLLPKFVNVRKDNTQSIADILSDLLKTDSEDMYQIYAEYVEEDVKTGLGWIESWAPRQSYYVRARIIGATERFAHREEFILLLWKKLNFPAIGSLKIYIGDALVNVASTTCSTKLAKFLMDWGANVDHRRNGLYLTPLHHAARQTTCEAAELMKFLLLNGADPELTYGRETKRVTSDGEGAKNIAKWLGISWDSLILKVKEEREKTNIQTQPDPD
jgi:Ankyrin repeat